LIVVGYAAVASSEQRCENGQLKAAELVVDFLRKKGTAEAPNPVSPVPPQSAVPQKYEKN
jgi:hypothetical protein